MTGRDAPATERSRASFPDQVAGAIRHAVTGPRALGALLSLALIVVAGLLAPGDPPDTWVWIRVLAVWLLATIALATIAGATFDNEMPRVSPLIVWGSLLLAVVISLTFTVLAATLAILILILLLFNLRTGNAPQPAIFWLLITLLTPMWVWSAFEAWNPWLLMLVPIGVVGVMALAHAVRAASDDRAEQRLASWIWVVTLGAALLVVALLADIAPGWVATGALVATAIAAIDLFAVPAFARNLLRAAALPILALLALTLGWLVAL